MPDVLSLRARLKQVADQEKQVYHSDKPRQYFIEWFGASDVEDLLEQFTPDTHNSGWQAEYPKFKTNSVDIDKIIKDRRAIAYMYAGKQCMSKHYDETELKLHVQGLPRMYWVLNELDQLQRTQKPGSPVWTAPED